MAFASYVPWKRSTATRSDACRRIRTRASVGRGSVARHLVRRHEEHDVVRTPVAGRLHVDRRRHRDLLGAFVPAEDVRREPTETFFARLVEVGTVDARLGNDALGISSDLERTIAMLDDVRGLLDEETFELPLREHRGRDAEPEARDERMPLPPAECEPSRRKRHDRRRVRQDVPGPIRQARHRRLAVVHGFAKWNGRRGKDRSAHALCARNRRASTFDTTEPRPTRARQERIRVARSRNAAREPPLASACWNPRHAVQQS